ncbi:MAG: hypothetical protein FWD71_12205, partial [Oscillospiraceae bacterium]|nr:hypothetical protein [Oscillospiraceae bacterium]
MSTDNNFIVVITDQIGDYISPFHKENLYCFEPLRKILKQNLQEFYNIPGHRFLLKFSDMSADEYREEKINFSEFSEDEKNLPVLVILHDCFDITKKFLDNIFEEYKSSGNI